jgi:hypothetical protein
MVSRVTRRVLIVGACCLVVSCGSLGSKKIPRAAPIRFPKANALDGTGRNPKQVGTILMVNGEGKFVVIDSGFWKPPESGTALKCMRDGVETGIVAVGEERRGGHVVADIVTGEPRKGDQVFQ